MRVFLFRGLLVAIVAALAICLYEMLIIQDTYVHEEQVHNAVLAYAPPTEAPKSLNAAKKATAAWGSIAENPGLPGGNQFIKDAQRNISDAVAAWLRVPNTCIDYPVVQGGDNSFYLNHDCMGQKSASGSLFVDSRNNAGFVDYNTVIYGHNMKNGSMFGELGNFGNSIFFSNNPAASLYLSDCTYTLEIFAYLKVRQDDKYVYGSMQGAIFADFDAYVKSCALNYRDIGLADSDRIVTLSTCANDNANSRTVVLARLERAD